MGPLAVLTGFRRDEVEFVAGAWQLDLGGLAEEPLYEITRVPWSAAVEAVWSSADTTADELAEVRVGAEDALIGRGGVVWLESARQEARIALRGHGTKPEDLHVLLGASFAHALALKGWLPLHGMAAALDGIGFLALGGTMAGKSALAAALLRAGGRLVSDDFLLVGLAPDGVRANGLRKDLRLRETSWGLVPEDLTARLLTERGSPERKILSPRDAPERFLPWTTPRVLWYLDGMRSRSMVETWPLTQSVALTYVVEAASPLFVGPRYRTERARLLPVMKALVESTACFRVRLGTELLAEPNRTIEVLLEATLPGGKPRRPSDT